MNHLNHRARHQLALLVAACVALCASGATQARAQVAARNDHRTAAAILDPFRDTGRIGRSDSASDMVAPSFRAMLGAAVATPEHRRSSNKIAAIVTGVVVGGLLGAVIGNKYAHDHAPGLDETPGFSRMRADHSTADRLSGIAIGIGAGAVLGAGIDASLSR